MTMRSVPLACSILAALAAACSTSSHVLVGKPRPAIPLTEVKIYLHPPAKYQEIALLDASSQNSTAVTAQGKTNKVIERLKKEAASLGANGVLLQGLGNQTTGGVAVSTANAVSNGGGYTTATGTTVFAGTVVKTGSALAIYVEQE